MQPEQVPAGQIQPQTEVVQSAAVRYNLSPGGDFTDWLTDLQDFLYNSEFLKAAEPDDQRRTVLVSPEAMQIWQVAFTAESFNPNIGYNYEELEKLGDAVIKSSFTVYLLAKFPGQLDKQQLSDLGQAYLKKPEQSKISIRYGLDQWVLTAFDVSMHVQEDIMEAVAGALFTIGDRFVQFGAGSVLVLNFVSAVFDQINISTSISSQHPKTRLKDMFQKMGWTEENINEIETWQTSGEIEDAAVESIRGIMVLKWPPRAIEDLKYYGIRVPDEIITSISANSKKASIYPAYTDALKRLKSLGITPSWVNEIQTKRVWADPDLAKYYPTALAKARKQGYVDINLKLPRRGTRGNYAQLIGITADGTLAVLSTAVEPPNVNANKAKKSALIQYLQSR